MKRSNLREEKKQESLKRVMLAIREISQEQRSRSTSDLPSTRDIADRCDLSIYNARHMLIKLQDEGMIAPVKGENKRMLYWETL
ncbi:FaeA/PapI family transcriptional regulator [Pantoea sp. 1.19]|uniref:FaeA/PapI family transcriptional regulator n=1 Tax=Pantoea sp. 1.19 TaxID=1925589 RepID=UPI00094905B6|nr:FaeA/PapI family transcriptional regulator [Pantoea sp. 1.19]